MLIDTLTAAVDRISVVPTQARICKLVRCLSKCNETHFIFLALGKLRGHALPTLQEARKDPRVGRET